MLYVTLKRKNFPKVSFSGGIMFKCNQKGCITEELCE